MFELYIGVNRERYIGQSLTINDAIGERTTCSFQVIDAAGTKAFSRGQPYEISAGETLIAAGVIDSSSFVRYLDGTRIHSVRGADWHYLADKRVAARAYTDTAAGDIVRNLADTYLAAEGVTYTAESIQDGPEILEAVYNYTQVSRAIEALSEKTGFLWMIDENKVLHFVPRSTYAAPWTATVADMARGSAVIESTNPKYRNRQYIRGGRDITDTQVETAAGDGEAKSFVVSYPLAKVPAVEISLAGGAWIEQTVGIRELSSGKQWYWAKGSPVVSQDTAGAVLVAGDKLRVSYQGEYDVVIISQSPEAIEAQQTIEGSGTGYVEDVHDAPSIGSRESGFQTAAQYLAKYAVDGRRLQFRTARSGLKPGQLLTVDRPDYGLVTAEMLIESVRISADGVSIWYDVTAIEGPEMGSWTRVFAAMATRGEAFVIRENIQEEQVLITLAEFSRDWLETDSPNIFAVVRPSDSLFPGAAIFPMFAAAERVKYLAWYNNGDELGRKPVTRQSGTDILLTTTYVAPYEGNGEITHLGWVGGYLAAGAAGTGVLVDLQAYEKTKTVLEALQVDKTDTRWE